MKNKKNFEKILGLTLLEILVSMVIFALTMGGLANLFISTKRLMLRAGTRMALGEISKSLLDTLQMQVRQDQWGNNCVSTDGEDTGGCDTTTQEGYTPSYDKAPVGTTELRRVILTFK